jgi:exosortase
MSQQIDQTPETQKPTTTALQSAWGQLALRFAPLAICVLWAYWTTLAEMAGKWSSDPQYSHGFIVPLFAVIYLIVRRDEITSGALSPSWWGLPVIIAAAALRLAGAYYFYGWFDHISLLPMLAGVALTIGGWKAFRWSWVSIAFLAFMIPMPYRLERALAEPLQRIATTAGTYGLQTLGVAALAEGNIILVDETRMNIADACSGLRMLIVFFALSFAIAILIERPFWEKIVVILCAAPIAIVSNVTRIVSTGVAHALGWHGLAEFIHDHAEWLMMPLALGLVWLVLAILSRLFIVPGEEKPLKIDIPAPERTRSIKLSAPAEAATKH